MSGIKCLLDTNFILGMLRRTPQSIERIEGRPEYLRMTWPTYLIGVAYERLVNANAWLAMFRILLVVEMRRGGDSVKTGGVAAIAAAEGLKC
jgi:hypothetical protein